MSGLSLLENERINTITLSRSVVVEAFEGENIIWYELEFPRQSTTSFKLLRLQQVKRIEGCEGLTQTGWIAAVQLRGNLRQS